MKLGLIGLGMLATLAMIACGGGDDDDDDVTAIDAAQGADAAAVVDAAPPDGGGPVLPETLPDPLPTGPVDVKVLNFNTGLIQAVKGAEQRHPLIIEALETVDADVMCLEELYNEYETPAGMAAALADKFPYSFWSPVGVTPYRNGVLILSKYPLYQGRVLFFENNNTPPFPDRALIAAHIVAPTWHAPIMCTHLQAGLANAPDRATRLAEVGEVHDFAMAQGYLDGGPAFFLGDFNAGPDPDTTDFECDDPMTTSEVELCEPADMEAYNAVLADWTDPFPLDAPCSSCRDQYLALELIPGLFAAEPDQRIDHCFYRGLSPSDFVTGGLVLDEVQSIPYMDETLKTLSDHYAVRCVFGPAGGGT